MVFAIASPGFAAEFADAGFLGKGDKPVASLKGQAPVKKYELSDVTQAVDKKGVVTSQTAKIGALINGEYDKLPVIYSGNSSANHGYKVSANKSYNEIKLNGEVVGFFTFDKSGNDPKNPGNLIITLTKDVKVGVRWDCSKYYAYAMLDGIGVYSLPQLMQDNGKAQSFDQIWILTVEPNIKELKGSLSFEKKVEDQNIVEWLDAKGFNEAAIKAILAGLEFTLTGVDNNNAYGPVSPAYPSGIVSFTDIVPGTYTLSEAIKGAAIGKFMAMADVEVIIADGDDQFFVIGGSVKITVGEANFNKGDLFTIINGYGSGYVLGYPGLNNTGDVFPIAVTHVESGKVYPSFCAHGGSRAFAGQSGLECEGYMVQAPESLFVRENVPYLDFVKAYNYIEDNYGNLNDFRGVTQIVTWILLGEIDIQSDKFANIDWTAVANGTWAVNGIAGAKAIVLDVIANYKNHSGVGVITSVAYMICENDHAMYDCQPQLVPLYGTFYVENELVGDPKGTFKLKKMVDENSGELKVISEWLVDEGLDLNEILADISFILFASDEEGIKGAQVATGSLGADDMITFTPKVTTGWYLLHEEMGAKAKAVFGDADDTLFYFNAETEVVTGNSSEFDKSAFYIVRFNADNRRSLGLDGLNGGGEIFPISVVNTTTDEVYASYCAHAGSKTFAGYGGIGCAGYMVAGYTMPNEPGSYGYETFISALNYIEDEIGNLSDNRAITQTIIWILLGAIDINSSAFNNITELTPFEKASVIDTFEAAMAGYAGKGTIVDLVYMTCENHEHDFEFCQPQLVPVYKGEVTFINKPKENENGRVSFNKTKYGGRIPIAAGEFEFDLFKYNNETEEYDELIGTYSNDANGVVSVDNLAPGKYVFKEVLKNAYQNGSVEIINGPEGWGYVWCPNYPNGDDGVYFEISAGGETLWPEGYVFDGKVTVDNMLYCKHTLMWGSNLPGDALVFTRAGNYIHVGDPSGYYCLEIDWETMAGWNPCEATPALALKCPLCGHTLKVKLPGEATGHQHLVPNRIMTAFYGWCSVICADCGKGVYQELGYGFDEEFWNLSDGSFPGTAYRDKFMACYMDGGHVFEFIENGETRDFDGHSLRAAKCIECNMQTLLDATWPVSQLPETIE